MAPKSIEPISRRTSVCKLTNQSQHCAQPTKSLTPQGFRSLVSRIHVGVYFLLRFVAERATANLDTRSQYWTDKRTATSHLHLHFACIHLYVTLQCNKLKKAHMITVAKPSCELSVLIVTACFVLNHSGCSYSPWHCLHCSSARNP